MVKLPSKITKEIKIELLCPTQQSPCLYCDGRFYDKNDCCEKCEHISMYQKALSHLEEVGKHHGEIVQEYLMILKVSGQRISIDYPEKYIVKKTDWWDGLY